VYVAKGKEVKEGEKYSFFGGVLKSGAPTQHFKYLRNSFILRG
jgi:hypothetical protein